MVYTVKANNTTIYTTASIDPDLQIIDPQLEVELNKAGKFEFVLPPGHTYYSSIENMCTSITVYADSEVLFDGRVLYQQIDIYGQKTITCEGCLSYLLDSVLRPETITNMKVKDVFARYIAHHNSQVEVGKRFTVGNITVADKEKVITKIEAKGYGDTRSAIDSNLIDKYGGWMRVRYVTSGNNTTRYIDWLGESDRTNTQELRFGTNLINLEIDESSNELFTVLIPLGKDNLTIKSVTQGGVDYIEATDAKNKYGTIIRAKQFSDIDNATKLYNEGVDYLTKYVNGWKTTYDITAVDLYLIDPSNYGMFLVGDKIRVHVPLQNVNKVMTCLSINYDILNPENTTYKIGNYEGENAGGNSTGQGYTVSNSSGSSINTSMDEYLAKLKKQLTVTDEDMKIKTRNLEIESEELKVKTNNLEVLAHNIDLAVQALDGSEIVSRINLTPEGVFIQGNKIQMDGKTLEAIMTEKIQLGIKNANGDDLVTAILMTPEGLELLGENITINSKKLSMYVKDTFEVLIPDLDGESIATMIKASKDGLELLGNNITIGGKTLNIAFSAKNIANQINANDSGITIKSSHLDFKGSGKDLISEINVYPGQVRIAAKHVVLDGLVTATELQAALADFEVTLTDFLVVDNSLTIGGDIVTAGQVVAPTVACGTLKISGTTYSAQGPQYVITSIAVTPIRVPGVGIINSVESINGKSITYLGTAGT